MVTRFDSSNSAYNVGSILILRGIVFIGRELIIQNVQVIL
jgi:hypothetical protein